MVAHKSKACALVMGNPGGGVEYLVLRYAATQYFANESLPVSTSVSFGSPDIAGAGKIALKVASNLTTPEGHLVPSKELK